jgi:hypothetical protein
MRRETEKRKERNMLTLLKPDTLAQICADLEEAIEEAWAESRERIGHDQAPEVLVSYHDQALEALVSDVGKETANEMIDKAAAR